MKRKLTALKSIMIVSAFLLPLNLLAQEDVGDLFKSSPADATKLVDAYISPLFKGLGVGLNSGWNTSAKTKGFLRFDLRITGTLAFVPTKDQTYNAGSLGLQNIKPAIGANGIGPTAFGEDSEGSKMDILVNGAPSGKTFNLPQGTGIHFVPSPQVQLTVGLPKNIDISLRLVPKIKLGDDAGSINMFGIGAKVEVLPLIMGKKDKLLPFDLAVALGLTRLNYTLPLDINNGKYTNQELDIKINGFSADAIISKKLLFFTPFASVGFNTSKSNLSALGTYDFDAPTIGNPNATQTYTDPVALKNNDISGMKASVGFQLKLAFFKIYASYTAAQYSYVNGGIGFGFGK
ncbi:hypothetical protein GM921_08400 [Pedobacter sp. LMG 31464]|uniref:Outer membrane protein beta-barrel domain-containing protein n=1 Tax=Pedobacter planticolens TaxID=2679964 RepID=A0A923IU46_9SPHI|nr:DUF6588 family protein [Pedobacter planticolens]MBB2145500.1 hypothetical protein [Pedobacter planticolens]